MKIIVVILLMFSQVSCAAVYEKEFTAFDERVRNSANFSVIHIDQVKVEDRLIDGTIYYSYKARVLKNYIGSYKTININRTTMHLDSYSKYFILWNDESDGGSVGKASLADMAPNIYRFYIFSSSISESEVYLDSGGYIPCEKTVEVKRPVEFFDGQSREPMVINVEPEHREFLNNVYYKTLVELSCIEEYIEQKSANGKK